MFVKDFLSFKSPLQKSKESHPFFYSLEDKMNDSDIVTTLNLISFRLNQILPIIYIIAGTFGHICNIIIFSKRSQRTNPIAVYFLSSTVANLIVIYFGVLVRYLQDIYNIDPVNNNQIACRIRSFLIYLALSLSNWYILLGTIDRYLISSDDNRRRQLSTIKNAYRLIGILTIILSLCYIHILILYNIQTFTNTSNHLQNFCYPQRGNYRIFNDIQVLVQFSFLPPVLMSIFVVLIIRNIRASHKRIANTVVAQHHARIKKRDLQLSKMLLVQVSITIICSLPLATSQLLTTMTLTWSKTILRLTIESFFSQIGRLLAFFNCSISFYLYTLTGSQFRLEFRQIINKLTMFMCGKRLLEKRRIEVNQESPIANAQELPTQPQPKTQGHLNVIKEEASKETVTQL